MIDKLRKVKSFFTRSDFFIGMFIFLFIAGFSVYSIYKIIDSETAELKENLRVVSEDMANQIRLKMNKAFEINKFNKNYLKAASLQTKPSHISRAEILECYKEQLSDNTDFLALYTLWEPNAFDNRDSLYKGQPFHDNSGRFVPYIFRLGSKIIIEPCLFYDTIDSANYYQLPKTTKKEVLINPYSYPIDGKETLLISAITPIIIDNEFKGITGVDFTADYLQKMISNLTFLGNDVQVCIYSSNAVIIAMEGHPELSGKKIQSLPVEYQKFVNYHKLKNNAYENSDIVTSCTSFPLGDTQTSWKICVTAPKSIIYNKLKEAGWKFALVLLLLILFILLILGYRRSKTEAKASKLTLQSIIDNIQHSIWAVNKNYMVTLSNHKFKENVKNNYKIKVKSGSRLGLQEDESKFWIDKYKECFNGASVSFEKKYDNGRSFQYWLYPFIIKNEITGVMSMSVEITEKEEFYEMNKKIAEYQITALHAVMNPHFMYNSLNSIQYFVAKNERKMALDALSLFSSLIRKLLDSAVTHQISLKTELEILTHYIKLEKLRFEEKFTYAIILDPSIDVEEIRVPSLMIQPYVENAILHGIMNKDGQGSLKIEFVMDDNTLLMIIEDDGVGRKKAKQISESNIVKEKTYGMLLTKERLDIINKTNTVSIQVEDLENSAGEATGTRVTIGVEV